MGRITYTVMENTPGEMKRLVENAVDITNRFASHPGNATVHITQTERVKWNKASTDSEQALTDIGNKSGLQTSNKTNLVSAVNELFTSANNGKTAVASAITEKGVSASPTDTFTVLASKVGQINTGKKFVSGELNTSSIVNIRNLDFRPSIVIVKQGRSGSNPWDSYPWVTHVYWEAVNLNEGFYKFITPNEAFNYTTKMTIYNDGFYVPLLADGGQTIKPTKWIAFE